MELKKEVKIEEKKSNVNMENRKKMLVTGVQCVISFDEEKILLNTNLGKLIVRGMNLKMDKLDVQNGEVLISGRLDSCAYKGTEQKQQKENILYKLFK